MSPRPAGGAAHTNQRARMLHVSVHAPVHTVHVHVHAHVGSNRHRSGSDIRLMPCIIVVGVAISDAVVLVDVNRSGPDVD